MRTFMQHRRLKLGLEYHDELNPVLWTDDMLDPLVRERLLTIADKYREYAKIPQTSVKDITISGGSCNYNYTPLSDLDLHLVIDYADMGGSADMVKEYFMAKKDLWSIKHFGLKIYGIPLEIFAQDMNHSFPAGQGCFSITRNEWVQKPPKVEDAGLSNPDLYDRVRRLEGNIKHAIRTGDVDAASALKDKIAQKRADALQGPRANEFAFHNQVFKSLRNRGVLEKLKRFLNKKTDETLSL